jgi:hypothetical protein
MKVGKVNESKQKRKTEKERRKTHKKLRKKQGRRNKQIYRQIMHRLLFSSDT